MSVSVEGGVIVDATTAGTVAAEQRDDPSGLRFGGYERTELATGKGARGAISLVILSLTRPTTLPPVGQETVARFFVEATRPEADECRQLTLRYEDGLRGAGGPILNAVTWRGQRCLPEKRSATFEVCGHAGSWIAFDGNGDGVRDISDIVASLDELFHGGRRSLCREAMDYNRGGRYDLGDPVAVLWRMFFGALPPFDDRGCRTYESCDVSSVCGEL